MTLHISIPSIIAVGPRCVGVTQPYLYVVVSQMYFPRISRIFTASELHIIHQPLFQGAFPVIYRKEK